MTVGGVGMVAMMKINTMTVGDMDNGHGGNGEDDHNGHRHGHDGNDDDNHYDCNAHGGKNEDVQYKERLNLATWAISIGHGGGNGDNAKEEETVKHWNSQPGLRCNDIWALTPLFCLCSGCNEEMLE